MLEMITLTNTVSRTVHIKRLWLSCILLIIHFHCETKLGLWSSNLEIGAPNSVKENQKEQEIT